MMLTDEEIEGQLAAVPPPDPIPLDGGAAAPEPEPEAKPKRTRTRRTASASSSTRTRAKTTTDRAPRATARKNASRAQVAETVRGVYELSGELFLPMAGRPLTGAALCQMAPEAAEVWAAVAEKYPAVGKLFSAGDGGMLFVKLFMIHMPLLAAIRAEGAAASAAEDGTVPGVDTVSPLMPFGPGVMPV